MQVYRTLPQPPLLRPSNLTIGNFDGVHLGHQALLEGMMAHARRHERQAGLLTFDPHPAAVLRPGARHQVLTTVTERLEVLAELGMDFAVVIPFTRQMSQTSAKDFVVELQQSLNLAGLWVGPDFALGRNREGDLAALQAMGQDLGFQVQVIRPQTLAGDEIRSGRIRAHVLEGEVEAAARKLGRPYQVSGLVVAGAKRGRSIGFPTANLDVPDHRLLPADGVYATWAQIGGLDQRVPGVTNIGVRPSFDNGQRTVETHLLDFGQDLYGRELRILFIARLRPEMRFPSVEALRKQIALDVATARELFQSTQARPGADAHGTPLG